MTYTGANASQMTAAARTAARAAIAARYNLGALSRVKLDGLRNRDAILSLADRNLWFKVAFELRAARVIL